MTSTALLQKKFKINKQHETQRSTQRIVAAAVGGASVFPLASVFGGPGSFICGWPACPGPSLFNPSVSEPLINCMGPLPSSAGRWSGQPFGRRWKPASRNFVQYDGTLPMVSASGLADLTKTEWGMVSAECAAGLKHVTAACVTGGNPEKLIRIPTSPGSKKQKSFVPADRVTYTTTRSGTSASK